MNLQTHHPSGLPFGISHAGFVCRSIIGFYIKFLEEVHPFLFGFMSLIEFSLLCARIRSQFIEKRRTMIAMGSPTQKMCMTMPMAIILKENGNFIAPESGTTTRFMKK
jgi:hypothetical protein